MTSPQLDTKDIYFTTDWTGYASPPGKFCRVWLSKDEIFPRYQPPWNQKFFWLQCLN